MQALQDLYLQNPFWIWLAVGAVFVALDIAIGWGRLVWGGAAAAVLALLNLAGLHLGSTIELSLFAVMAIGGVAITFVPRKAKRTAPVTSEPAVDFDDPAILGAPPGRLIGRIGRTTSEFANGVGRVWIDGAEWSAELEGEETLPADAPVRVLAVSGGVRLRVRTVLA